MNPVTGNLPDVVGDVPQAVGKRGSPGIHLGGGVVRGLMQSLELGLLGYQRRRNIVKI